MAIKPYSDPPYFDDYFNDLATGGKSPRDKNYLRILFQPGYAVQVRELNQIQTLLQNQIDQFGKSVYKEGTPVIDGLTSYDTNIYFADIEITLNAVGNVESYISQITKIQDNSQNLKAEVLGIKRLYDQSVSSPDTVRYRFFVRYLNSIVSGNTNTQEFTLSETIQNAGDAILDSELNTVLAQNIPFGSVVRIGYAASIHVDKGVFFINGHFVVADKTSAFITKTSETQEIDGEIVWKVTESEVTASDDNDLLDNAAGQPNYVAPGGNRYQISLELKFLTDDTSIIGDTTNVGDAYHVENNNSDVLIDTAAGQFVNLLTVTANKALIPARTEYTQLDRVFAERTFDESGNYTVKPFQLDLREYLNDELGNRGKYATTEIQDLDNAGDISLGGDTPTEYGEQRFVVGLEPSTAYVQGYRIELDEKVELPVEKARTTDTLEDLEVSATIGGYVIGELVDGGSDQQLFVPEDGTTATITESSSSIGSCKLRNIEKISSDRYHLYIYDVTLNAGKTLANADSIDVLTSSEIFKFQSSVDGGSAKSSPFKLQRSGDNNLLIQLPASTLQSVTIDKFPTREKFDISGTSSTINTGTPNKLFYTDAASEYVLLSEDNADVDITSFTTTGITAGLQSITFNHDAAGTNGSMIAPLQVDSAAVTLGTKSYTTATVTLTNQGVESGNYIVLNTGSGGTGGTSYYDGIRITELRVNTGSGYIVVPKGDYVFDNGQRDNYYDECKIQYIGSEDYSTSTNDWEVDLIYWNHNETDANYDYYSVNSYDSTYYADIPYYQGVKLSDVVDFRKKKNSTHQFPIDPNGLIEISSLTHYEGRIDKVLVNSVGEFSVAKGLPSLTPIASDTSKDSMALYELNVPAYTESIDDIDVKYLDNRRYTMKDIGGLERRIKNVEYYTSLSLLERETLDKGIFDASGNQRFKNGILVDSFFGHNIGNPRDNDHKCSIDAAQGILRPQFEMNNTLLKTTTSAELNSDIIELDYTENTLINQPLASISESVNPFDLADWQGFVKLDPTTDEWKETNQRPDIVINDTSAYDQFVQMANEQNILGTIWDEWEVAWRGTSTTERKIRIGRSDKGKDRAANRAAKAELGFNNWRPIRGTLKENFETTVETRSGIRRTLNHFDHTFNAGERVVDISFVPFIRSRQISIEAKLMKPNTLVHAFFDGVNVSDYCTAISDMTGGGTYADVSHDTARDKSVATFKDRTLVELQSDELSGRHALITDDNGILRATFIIPNNSTTRFRTGERIFKLTDSSTNQDAESTTSAQTTYNASGLIESKANTIISTRIPQIDEQRISRTRNSTVLTSRDTSKVRYYDPLAQSFIIGDYVNGIYATKIDLYFQKKHPTIPVRTHLVTVENGIPTQKVVPGTEVILNPSDSQFNNVDTGDGTGANAAAAVHPTTFEYEQPVHLQPGVEYAIVVLSNSPEYRLWMAETGGTDNVTQEKITKNPYAGVSFKSQNASTWTPNQNRDFKFKIYKAAYDQGNKTVNFETTFNGSVESVTVGDGGNYSVDPTTVTFSSPQNGGTTATGTIVMNGTAIDSITITNPGSGYTSPPSITISGGTVVTSATLTAVLNEYENSYIRLLAEEVKLPGTNITYQYHFGSDSAQTINANENINLASSIKKIGANSAAQKVTVTATLSTTDTNITPQLDSQRLSLLSIYNLINNPTTQLVTSGSDPVPGVDTNDDRIGDGFSYLTDSGLGSVQASYITRSVVLNSPANRLNTYLLVNRPNINTNIRVFIKLREGDEEYTDVEWYEVSPTEDIPVNAEEDYSEVEFDFDTELFNASSPHLIEFNAFAVRVVLTSNDHRFVPTVKDFRAIATFS